MEQLEECPACKAPNHRFVRKCKDFTVSAEEFNVVQCNECRLLFTNPRPDINEIAKYYESSDYISHSNTNKGLISKLYKIVRNFSLKRKISLLNRLNQSPDKNILDIGCGTGEFLSVCMKNNWNCIGVEPNEKARTQAIENWGLKVYKEDYLNEIDNVNKFNAVSMWHVLEHVHSLTERLTQIQRILSKNGLLIIAVPNPHSADAVHYQDNWAAYDVPRHLYHFTPEVLKNLIAKYDFSHVESIGMKFDSFYVSMLSEKYINKSGSIPRAFFNGIKSNLKATADPEKYSSVIYVFRKNK